MFDKRDIPIRLQDKTLRLDSSWYALCILLRLTLGLTLIYKANNLATCESSNIWKYIRWAIIIILVIPLIGFTRKHIILLPTWKSYLRAVLSLALALILFVMGWIKSNPLYVMFSGLIIMLDVLSGVMSRHLVEILGNN